MVGAPGRMTAGVRDRDKMTTYDLRPGDPMIWPHSGKISFIVGWRVQRIPDVVVRTGKRKILLKV